MEKPNLQKVVSGTLLTCSNSKVPIVISILLSLKIITYSVLGLAPNLAEEGGWRRKAKSAKGCFRDSSDLI
jgi:hypothetical protein